MNHVAIIGNLCKDPTLRYTQAGKAVCNGSLAYNTGTKDKKIAHFFQWAAWEKTAELIHQYFKKGSKVCFEGRLQQRSWEDKDGQKKSIVEILVTRIHFVGTPTAQNATGTQETAIPSTEPVPAEEVTLPGEEMF